MSTVTNDIHNPANILIVDDNPLSLASLEAILEGSNRIIIKAASGNEALKCLLVNEMAVILLDVKMADMDGYETAALIRKRPKTHDVPIIFLTAFNKDNVDVLKGYSFGAVDYIFKPIVQEILRAKVDVLVELYKKNHALRRKNEELERAERELLQTKAVASLIKYAPDPVFVSDLNANILHANDAASQLLGLHVEELAEQSLSGFLSTGEAQLFKAALHEVVERGITRNISLHPRSASGTVTPTTLNASALVADDGKTIGAIGIFRDMTAYEQVLNELEQLTQTLERRVSDRTQALETANQRLEELNRLKSSFVSIASHEIRTPVTSIKAFAENMLSGIAGPVTEKQHHCLSRIISNVERLTRIIQELLDLAKIEAGQLNLQLSLLAVAELIHNVIEQFQPLALEKHISLESSGSALGTSVSADEGKLQQVLSNLVHNAIKFTPSDGRVTIEADMREDGALQVCVSDTGAGIAAEEISKIFDRFYSSQSIHPENRGAGLGLTICKSLIALHGGKIWVTSTVGQGSRFYFDVPATREV
ncbi:MAG: hybrid sensor histidine kinase/response regulator [Nitrospiraceae bacterium]